MSATLDNSPFLSGPLVAPDGSCAELGRVGRRVAVRFGDVDIGREATGVTSSSALNEMPSTVFSVKPADAELFDYAARLTVDVAEGGAIRGIFSGEANSATLEESAVGTMRVEAHGGNAMKELLSPIMSHWGPAGLDIMYMLARTSGLSEDQVSIQGLPQRPDVFEVAVPVEGASVESAMMVGSVRFLPPGQFRPPVANGIIPEPLGALVRMFTESPIVAVTYVADKSRMYDAESEGLARIRSALSWARVKAAYSASVWPGHLPREFLRAEMRTSLRAQDGVLVKGLTSGRAWVRTLEVRYGPSPSRLDRASGGEHLQPPSRFSEAQAVLACARAADEDTDPMVRVNALWEALEFLASSVESVSLFSKAQTKQMRRTLVKDLSAEQRERLTFALGQLNQASLMWKIRRLAELMAVPVSEGEFTLLRSLRSLRNDAVHGKRVQLPSNEDLALAVSVVCRLLVYSVSSGARS